MKLNLFLTIIFACFFFITYSQILQPKNNYFKLSGGRIAFGTGDYFGYSIGVEYSKNIIKKPAWGLSKFLVGGELLFESGVENPVIVNPTLEEYFSKNFYHTSSSLLWPKISYYPLKKIVKGFNIQLGPTIGYSYRSTESESNYSINPSGDNTRQSVLSFDNGFIIGYRISTGIEFNITRQLLTGFRLDFENNAEGEINTYIGLKMGFSF